MADLKINIIATDKASPSINKAAQALQNIAQQSGVLSSSMGRLATQLGGLIGAGGMAGLATAAVALAANLEDLKHEFADWATGMGDASEGLGELDQKTAHYIETLKKLRNQLELVGKAGLARTAAELGQRQREVSELDARLQARQRDIARLEALRAEQAKGFGVQGIGFITPGLKATEESLKRAKEEAAGLARELGAAQTELSIAAKTLTHEQAEEGIKRIGEQNKLLEKQRQTLEQIDQELEKRFGGNKPLIAPDVPMPILGPTIFDPEEMRRNAETVEKELEDMRFEGFKRLHEKQEDYLKAEFESGQKTMAKIEDNRERAMKENQRQWERMYDSIRDGAGEVFDAMLTKGESVFSSLGKFAQGVLQTMLRNVFQNAMTGLLTGGGKATGGGIMGSLLGFGGAAAGGAMARGASAAGGAGLQASIVSGGGKAAGGIGGFFGKLFGMGGSGAAGAAGMGGSLAMGAATAGISMAVALGASFIGGLFNRGAQKRAEEEARRKAAIEANQFTAPETISRYGIAGGAGYAVETDVTGSIRGIGKTPTVIVNVQNNMIDARHAREAGAVIGQEVSRQILQGGSLLADNIAWSAS